ncbi:Histidine phosphatase superfamily, clade-2 [Ophiocordyceps camponoti-floridani]|uniref:Histidine phosphatase superfamily, clade-2 n=1 Tax=Ophiocordyceps camponoti-floridani TaxID=2030778 RepID=A0A8H4Q8S0_9HYPO|nr:Histidine phosphatase superfamily, clade-2 [Ophiocordyceps camponoti-floridani]
MVLAAALLAALVVGRVAADRVKQGLTVWVAAAYISHGETTPRLSGSRPVLTPEGAQQLLRQGNAFRRRYLTPGSNSAIRNMSVDAIDTRQLFVTSSSYAWVAGSAQAFIQGLYPPRADAVPRDLGRDFATGNDSIDYPLGGYQYPLVQTLSTRDPYSVGLQGDVGCGSWQWEMKNLFEKRKDIEARIKATSGIYKALFGSEPLQGVIPMEEANYVNAVEVYNLVKYMYAHNETVFKNLGNADEVIRALRTLAYSSERDKTGYNGTAGGLNTTAFPGAHATYSEVYSIAGRTLAARFAERLIEAVASSGTRDKMTLMFGSSRPLVSFLSVAGLLTRQNLASGPLSRMPGPGASLVIEVVSDAAAAQRQAFPAAADLSVRFLYKPSADVDESLTTYPLFGSGVDGTTIPYEAFLGRMREKGTTQSEWCDICLSHDSSYWCYPQSNLGSSGATSVAVIAVLSTLLVIVVFTFLGTVVCLRYPRVMKKTSSVAKPPSRSWWTRKGPSDADVVVSQSGVREVRTGSWEMGQGFRRTPSNAGGTGNVRNFSTPRAYMVEDDGASLSGLPVRPRETI